MYQIGELVQYGTSGVCRVEEIIQGVPGLQKDTECYLLIPVSKKEEKSSQKSSQKNAQKNAQNTPNTIQGLEDFTEDDIKAQYQSFADSADALKDGKIDAAFIVAGAPTPAIQELCTSADAYLVPIDGDVAANLMASCPFYTTYKIPANTYTGQTEAVTTVTVKANAADVVISNAEDYDNLPVPEDGVVDLNRAMYDENDTNTQVLYLKNAVATFSSFTAAPEVHEF